MGAALRHQLALSGRAARGEFWVVSLALIVTLYALLLLPRLVFGPDLSPAVLFTDAADQSDAAFRAYIAFNLTGWIVTAPVAVRRLHDLAVSGWWYALVFLATEAMIYIFDYSRHPTMMSVELPAPVRDVMVWVILIPFTAYLLVCGVMPGTKGPNRYGADPLQARDDEAEVAAFD